MGMFDTVMIYMPCPYCNHWENFGFQTKDLDCNLDTYHPLDQDWETAAFPFGREYREKLPVFPKFPFDKEHTVWANQAERIEAQATLTEPFAQQLKYVTVYTDCSNCQKRIEGTLAVVEGKLRFPLILSSEKEAGDES